MTILINILEKPAASIFMFFYPDEGWSRFLLNDGEYVPDYTLHNFLEDSNFHGRHQDKLKFHNQYGIVVLIFQ